MEDQVPPALLVVMGTAAMLSLASLFYLFQKHIDGRSLLTYQPRQRVPWGVGIALLAISMPLANVVVFLTTQSEEATAEIDQDEVATEESEEVAAQEIVTEEETAAETADHTNADAAQSAIESQIAASWGSFAFMLAFTFGVGTLIAVLCNANASDLGLPTSWPQALQDIGIGCLATLASLLPIYVVQLVLINVLDEKTKHPLVEQLEANPSSAMLTVGFAMAVIAAPLFEEFTFRCLLQGWLERHEDETVGFDATARSDTLVSETVIGDTVVSDTFLMDPDPLLPELPNSNSANTKLPGMDEPDSATLTMDESDPLPQQHETQPPSPLTPHPSLLPKGLIPALPHGWTPILISGIVFGLAHLGHGVAPISLILFGIVLAYLYQRTHRLLPSITAHMVFNGYSILLLWLQLGAGR